MFLFFKTSCYLMIFFIYKLFYELNLIKKKKKKTFFTLTYTQTNIFLFSCKRRDTAN